MINTYCPFIYHQQMVDFYGKVSACCQFEASSNYEQYDQMMEPFRQAMEQGEKIKPCRRCWQDEDNGFPSLRQSAITDFRRYPVHEGIMILDVRITNNCNLACTMCNEHASSLWGKIKGKNQTQTLTQEVQDYLISQSKDLVRLSIQGGEPFYGKDFIDFVERLPNKSNMQLEIFSNTITADIEILSKWTREFKQVSFIASVDGHGETFESIRWPAKWNKLERKIKELYGIPKLGLNFNFTLQNLNILNIGKFVDWRNITVPNCPITISILDWPEHFQFTVLTEDEKIKALEVLKNMGKILDSEQVVLDAVNQQLLNATVNEKLLAIKDQQLQYIQNLRKNY